MGLHFDLQGGPRGPAAQEELIEALRPWLPFPKPTGPTSKTVDEELVVDLVGRGVAGEDARALEAHHRLAVERRDPSSGITLALSPDGTGWLHVESGASREATLPLMKLVWRCLEVAVQHGYAIVDVDLDADFGLAVSAYVRTRVED